MSQSSETSKENLYQIFHSLEKIKQDIIAGEHSEAYNLVHVLDEVLKLRADVEKLKANQP